jgi:hypothetical protein
VHKIIDVTTGLFFSPGLQWVGADFDQVSFGEAQETIARHGLDILLTAFSDFQLRVVGQPLGCGRPHRPACTGPQILFWVHNQARDDGIILDVLRNPAEFFVITNHMVIAFVLPKGCPVLPSSLFALVALPAFSDPSAFDTLSLGVNSRCTWFGMMTQACNSWCPL